MSMLVLNGKEVSLSIRGKIKIQTEALKVKLGRAPGLAVVLVGDDPASHVYVKNKIKACGEVGFYSKEVRLPANISESGLIDEIQKLNSDSKVDGILVQLPLPKHLNSDHILSFIQPEKDADGLTSSSVGLLHLARTLVKPCTPAGVIEILKFYKIPIAGKKVVVVGRSHIVGRPMAELLLQEDATVTICHSRTVGLQDYTKAADIVVVAAGRPEFLGAADFKKEAVVIDVGIHRTKDGLCGDVRFSELNVHAATPVPGGVGPMTITMLLQNTLLLAESVKK
jgi:methylenetetrahydrofolate dehydrogenase (NADP+)/methenyltetrahydrofolate cyclohydrolase